MHPEDDTVAAEAAQWLARRDRGLTPAEQDAYLDWYSQSKDRAAAIAELERAWERLDAVHQWRPAHSVQPNPDLLAHRSRRRTRVPWAVAAAAVLMLAAVLGQRTLDWNRPATASIVPAPEHRVLEDGSIVELHAGAALEVQFNACERRVSLRRGEAHFTVAKNPARPFVVDVHGYHVRAVGTAFLVQQGVSDVSVIVTEGRVRFDRAGKPDGAPEELAFLDAGQQAIVSGQPVGRPDVLIRELEPAELEAAMEWRGIRLEFEDRPLNEVVTEFNRFNARKLTIGDAETGRILVGGRFRADHLDAFVRLLESGFGVSAETRGDEIVLQRR